MRFELFDAVLERADDRVVALKQVTLAEEYLQDHFPGFPVLPGVLMIEALVQSARLLLEERVSAADPRRWVLGGVKAVKYGALVRPGDALVIEVARQRDEPDGSVLFRGQARVRRPGADEGTGGDTAVSGRFTMRRTTPAGRS